MIEEWKVIPKWDAYEVSNLGRVRRTKTGRIRVPQSSKQMGYLTVNLSMNNRQERCPIHRLVLLAFVGECPEGCETLHLDDDPTNNRLDNLRWGTPDENKSDNWKANRSGEKAPNAKLTEAEVRMIINSPLTHTELAKSLPVSVSHICQIRKRKTAWAHLTDKGLEIFEKDSNA